MHGRVSALSIRAFTLLLAAVWLMGCAVGVQRADDVAVAPPEQAAQTRPAPAPDPEADKIERPTSEPYDGDLSIFEGKKRAEKLQIDRVMDLLGIREGTKVADIGAGSGWFTVRAARRVGDSGRVYAVEINPKYLEHISERAEKENLPNICTILGKEDDPLLPKGEIDAVLLLKTYHEISQPIVLMRRVRESLGPAGRVGIIDRKGKGGDHGIDAQVVIKEMERAGFRLLEQHDFVKPDEMDYFLIFMLKTNHEDPKGP